MRKQETRYFLMNKKTNKPVCINLTLTEILDFFREEEIEDFEYYELKEMRWVNANE